MPSTLNPACPLCGLRFSNGALLDLHIREDHVHRNRPPEPDHDDSGDTSQVRDGPSQGTGQASSQPSSTDEMITATAARRPHSGPAIPTLRKAIGTLRYLSDKLLRASEAIFRSAHAPQPAGQPEAPEDKDARAASAARGADRAA